MQRIYEAEATATLHGVLPDSSGTNVSEGHHASASVQMYNTRKTSRGGSGSNARTSSSSHADWDAESNARSAREDSIYDTESGMLKREKVEWDGKSFSLPRGFLLRMLTRPSSTLS
eukprot:scaffold325896_cov31-Attheya_sp.AAC.1